MGHKSWLYYQLKKIHLKDRIKLILHFSKELKCTDLIVFNLQCKWIHSCIWWGPILWSSHTSHRWLLLKVFTNLSLFFRKFSATWYCTSYDKLSVKPTFNRSFLMQRSDVSKLWNDAYKHMLVSKISNTSV